MKYRKLRIAWSVVWGVVAALFVALWVRSYWRCDFFMIPMYNDGQLSIDSCAGQTGFHRVIDSYFFWCSKPIEELEGYRADGPFIFDSRESGLRFGTGDYTGAGVYTEFYAPHWFLVLVAVGVAVVSWVQIRFSLRTLLVATTLVAVGLGLIVWLTR